MHCHRNPEQRRGDGRLSRRRSGACDARGIAQGAGDGGALARRVRSGAAQRGEPARDLQGAGEDGNTVVLDRAVVSECDGFAANG